MAFDLPNDRWAGREPEDLGISKGWMSPGQDHQAELSWWAPFAADVKVEINASVASVFSDGVEITVGRDDGTVFVSSTVGFPTPLARSFSTRVEQGDEIYFRTSSGPAKEPYDDATAWAIDITMTYVDE